MMQSRVLSEVSAAPSQLAGPGTSAGGPLSATRFLSAADDNQLRLPGNRGPAAVAGIGVFMQIAALRTDNQIHDEQLMPVDEQSPYSCEHLASSRGCPTVTI